MAVQDRLYTAEDLENMPDDGKTYELHNGVLIEVPGSAFKQTRLAAWIIYLLTTFVEERKLGGTVTSSDGTFALSKYNTRIPDVAYVTAENAARQDQDHYAQGAPDLAIEVVSPSNSGTEMQQRAGEYINAGSRLVWIVNATKRSIDVYRAGGTRTVLGMDDVIDGADVLPGLALPIRRIFEKIEA